MPPYILQKVYCIILIPVLYLLAMGTIRLLNQGCLTPTTIIDSSGDNMEFNAPSNFIKVDFMSHLGPFFEREADEFLKVLDSATKEHDVQVYIKTNQKWFIPGSIMKDYDFGGYSVYLVPEQPLGEKFRVDYMILGFNSIGPQLILIEFEDVNVEYKNSSSNLEAKGVRKGLVQIRDWKCWLDENRGYFLKSCGLASTVGNIPSWNIHYCLVVSRRSYMSNDANQMRSRMQFDERIKIITYDRLVENIRAFSAFGGTQRDQ